MSLASAVSIVTSSPISLAAKAAGLGGIANPLVADLDRRAKNVAMYRKYYDGDHPANMTKEMRQALRIALKSNGGEAESEFHDNYMPIVVDTEADRIVLKAIVADNDAATKWAEDVLAANHIDALQAEVHPDALIDGETFLGLAWDNVEQRVVLIHEPAFDGANGMMAIYKSSDKSQMDAAVKVWTLADNEGNQSVRINVYLPGEVRKFVSSGDIVTPFIDESTDASGVVVWKDRQGQDLGIPVFHFKNRGRGNHGESELKPAIPMQNALNRSLHSLIMTEELTAFQVRVARGFQPPAAIAPGSIIAISPNKPLTPDQVADLTALPQGQINQFLDTANFLAFQIGKVTRTPSPEFGGGDNASGEALKQREAGLVGKVKKFNVKAGSVWEAVMAMAWKIEEAFGTAPADYKYFTVKWGNAEIRNEQAIISNLAQIEKRLDDETLLEVLAPIFDWGPDKVKQILTRIQQQQSDRMSSLLSSAPNFNNFNAAALT